MPALKRLFRVDRDGWLNRSDARLASTAMWAVLSLLAAGCSGPSPVETPRAVIKPEADGVFHVRAGQSIQASLDAAAEDQHHKRVVVHAGVYRPSRPDQALIHFVAKHDGITLEADGEVTLTAANERVADPGAGSFPAVVNHVVYFGHGISSATVVRGFRITGANGFVTTDQLTGVMEPDSGNARLRKGLFFYSDGGAIKIFGDSSPLLQNLSIEQNRTQLCGGGVSIENCGYVERAVRFENCIFADNSCPGTGSAVDVLEQSVAELHNCLFVRNIANTGMDQIRQQFGLSYNPEHGCGAITVFPESQVRVTRCTFTANWNGVDDQGTGSVYQDCIFWMNTASDGSRPGDPYEIDIHDASGVERCYFHGKIDDLQGNVDRVRNVLRAADPDFDEQFRPLNPEYRQSGYRPTSAAAQDAGESPSNGV